MRAPERPHLLSMLPDDLAAHLRAQGVDVREAEARRILAHAISLGRDGFPEARPVAARVTGVVAATTARDRPRVVERAADPTDGFVKYLFQAVDGALFEAVRIPLQRPGAFTVCLSSQAGCAMGCAFCATARLGLARDLSAAEIVGSFLAVRDDAPGRVTGAVFMGQGDPLANPDAVIRAARVLSDPCGGRISAPAISVSTVGPASRIRRYTEGGHPYRLIVSVGSFLPERRARLLPVAGREPLPALAAALREHAAATRERMTVAWVLIDGVNCDDAEVDALLALLGDIPLRINLIEVNDPRPDGFRPPSLDRLNAIRRRLCAAGIPVVRRYSGGVSAHAACGMLASRRVADRG